MYDKGALICPIKISEAIKFDLKAFRRKMPEYFEAEKTYSAIIGFLISEYERQHDPDTQAKQQKEIDDKYVTVERWTADVEEYRKKYEEFDNATKDLNDKIQSLEDKVIAAESTVEEQLSTIEGLQNNLSDKNNQISIERATVDKLTQSQTNLQESLKNLQYSDNMLADRYNKHQHNTNMFFFQKDALETLYYIGRYLKRHPKKLFTAEEICDKLQWKDNIPPMIIEDIQYALSLNKYLVLPVRGVNTPNGIAYRYDKRYLH